MAALFWIIAYFVIGWIVTLVLGIKDGTNSYQFDLIVVAGLFWPFFLFMSFCFSLCEWIEYLRMRYSIVGKILKVLRCVFLIFRPYTLGQEICEWFEKKRNKKESEDDDD